MQTGQYAANVGSRLKRVKARKAPSEKPAFQPYRGKPAVRNDRGDRGNVGIIRSPVRASILPDPKFAFPRVPPPHAVDAARIAIGFQGTDRFSLRMTYVTRRGPRTWDGTYIVS